MLGFVTGLVGRLMTLTMERIYNRSEKNMAENGQCRETDSSIGVKQVVPTYLKCPEFSKRNKIYNFAAE